MQWIRDPALPPGNSWDSCFQQQEFLELFSYSCSIQYSMSAANSSHSCPAHSGMITRPLATPYSLQSPAPVHRPAPGTSPRSSLVTVCHLPCTTANPIRSSFPTQVSSNWKYWEFWLTCCVIEKILWQGIKLLLWNTTHDGGECQIFLLLSLRGYTPSGYSKAWKNMGKSCPSQVVWTSREKPLSLDVNSSCREEHTPLLHFSLIKIKLELCNGAQDVFSISLSPN